MNATRDDMVIESIAIPEDRDLNRLRCNQFVLGPELTPGLPGWKRERIGERLELAFHPELTITRAGGGARTLTALGFMLDPRNPDASDRDILGGLLERFDSVGQLLDATAPLGGRWAIIATHDHSTWLFTDAFGLRQVFYTVPELVGGTFAMSQPAIGAEILGLSIDPVARRYMESHEFRADSEYRWPGSSSPFKAVRHLLPNHYLDLNTGRCRRFWPTLGLTRISLDEGVERAAALLEGLMRAAANRYELAVSVTAGIDSRVVLAACKDIRRQVSFVTVRQSQMPEDSPDITVPAALLAKLGLRHEVIRSAATMTPEFSENFRSSVFAAHDRYGPDAEAILGHYRRRKVAVTGSGGEVGRCPFREDLPIFDRKRVTPTYLSRAILGTRNHFAIEQYDDWLRGIGGDQNVNRLDLFEWEQECGNWLAMTQLEFDIAWKDVFTPFNCRDLMVTLLSVPPRFRKGPRCRLFRGLIRRLWPAVMDAPINPHRRPSALGHYVIGFEQLLRFFVQQFRYP